MQRYKRDRGPEVQRYKREKVTEVQRYTRDRGTEVQRYNNVHLQGTEVLRCSGKQYTGWGIFYNLQIYNLLIDN